MIETAIRDELQAIRILLEEVIRLLSEATRGR